ncbi:hypothetical protein F4813DRAFT_383003 [Daldinia decipiens]|uniref:uncharacterized protein n=1 Tax=Daldinia decipiens TaxID=326647 RepID=UPI0020C3A982|nr:uncharacterized protein F4813DRAFT_383003 [Daldinia decipiens]KAI1653882.1 hypothetical protein F4813DRAFT_383003 [Daldinia decipiens]
MSYNIHEQLSHTATLLLVLYFMVSIFIAAFEQTIVATAKLVLLAAIVVFFVVSLIGALANKITRSSGRSKYYGILGVTWGLACDLSPVVCGAFAEFVSWKWCFWVNLPIVGLAGIFVIFFPKVHTPKTPTIEGLLATGWLGMVTIVGAIVMFLLELATEGRLNHGTLPSGKWPDTSITPPRLFQSNSNIAPFGIPYIHDKTFMAVLGASPSMSGVYLLPVAVILCVVSSLIGVYISKSGRYRLPIYWGFPLMIIGIGLYIISQDYFSLTKPADIVSAAATFLFMRDMATAISGALNIIPTLPHAEWILYTALGAVGMFLSLLIRKQIFSRKYKICKTGLKTQEDARLEEAENKRVSANI